MPNRKLTYQVDMDTSDAVSDIRKLGTEGAKAGKALGDGLADGASTGTKAIAALGAQLDRLESEVKGTASAVQAIGAQMGDGFDSVRVEALVGDLRKMGVEFEEIEAQAKEFADVIERADGIKLDAVNSGLQNVGTSLDKVHDSADQSRSVMANLAGNAAQDLGAVAGVAGTLGVGLGQLAEYAAEGNIKMSELGKVAGPMAGLAAATFLVQQYMSGIAAVDAFNKDQVDSFTKAMREGSAAAAAIQAAIIETGQIQFSDESGIFGMSAKTGDLMKDLDELGLTYGQFMQLVTVQSTHGEDAMGRLLDSMLGLAPGELMAGDALKDLFDAVKQYSGNIDDAREATDLFNDIMSVTPEALNDSLLALRAQEAAAAATGGHWEVLTNWMREGGAATDESTAAMEALTEATGLTVDEILRMVDSKLDATMKANAESAEATAEAFERTRTAAADLDRTMSGAEFGAAGIAAAGDALDEWFASTPLGGGGGVQVIRDYNDAFDAFADNVIENGGIVEGVLGGMLVGRSDEQREQVDLLQQLGAEIMPRVARAYEQSGGSFSKFSRNVTELSDQIHRDLVTSLIEAGVSANDAEDQANALQQQLGLIPQNVETMYNLLGDADATAKLALIQGYIDELPASVQTEVAMHILADDPQAALGVVQTYVNTHSVNAPMNLDTGPAMTDYWALAGQVDNPLTAPVYLRVMNAAVLGAITGAVSRSAAPAAAGLTAAPTATTTTAATPAGATMTMPAVQVARPPVNIYVTAGVIGNTYDVQRAVRGALADAERLGRV